VRVSVEQDAVTVWIRGTGTGHSADHSVDCDREPCPAIMAGGLGGGNRQQYWLIDDGRPARMPTPTKPPYKVPGMAEIASMPRNGYSVVSTFSGCGGSCLGYRMAGYRVAWANEFIPAAREAYKANHPDSILDPRDVRRIKPEEILKAIGKRPGELDLFDGSPPCASFSVAGKREAGWGRVKEYSDTRQRTDDLFFEYARLLEGLRPKTFVAENVAGLVKGAAKGYFLEILAKLKSCGYRVSAKVLDAQWLGVPQMRHRLIFVGVREDLGIPPAHPGPLAYRYSVRDALPWIDRVKVGSFPDGVSIKDLPESKVWVPADMPMGTIMAMDHKTGINAGRGCGGWVEAPPVEPESDISPYKVGAKWDEIGPGGHVYYGSGLHRPDPDKPCPTITQTGGDASAASVCHPTEKRKFSIAELRRICGFPDDFILTGSYAQQWERLGRSVPPVMMARIAATVKDEVLCKISRP
jgi:DNA (cytosine-5)-methyltransferase 1